MFILRFVIAYVVLFIAGLFGQHIQRPAAKRFNTSNRIKATRHNLTEGRVNLTQVRAWHTVNTASSISAYINNIWEDALFVAREQNLMTGLVTTATARGLATRTLPIRPALTASEVAEGTDFSAASSFGKSTKATVTPKIAKTQVVITQAMIETDPDDVQRDAALEMGGAIATKIDTDLVDLFSGFSAGKGAAGSALTLANVAAGLSVLRKNKARGPFYVVLHPYGWHDIWVALGSPAATYSFLGDTANQAMRDYAVQRLINADWFTSANISVDSSDDAIGGVFNREALIFDLRKEPTMLDQFDASIAGGGAYELNMEVWYGVAERRDEYGCKITHDATEPV